MPHTKCHRLGTSVDGQVGNLLMDLLYDWLQCKGESQRTKGVPLLHPTLAGYGVVPEMEDGVHSVTAFHPGSNAWHPLPDFLEHVCEAYIGSLLAI